MKNFGPEVSIDNPALIHETALIYGKVSIAPDVSIWPYVVMRAELHEIKIGARSNIQDFVMIHVGYDHPTIIGEDCSITHHATLHGCEIGDNCLIGINATVMDGVKIGANSIVAGNSIVREGSLFPENSVIAGVPGKVIATRDNSPENLMNSRFYLANGRNYASGIHRISAEIMESIKVTK